ncbi:50S ribosomal protein L11 methyltransferase [Desulfurivibrio sp. C05AmB]|jgi:ribosomal protein L11 methyltransferase|uniref:50S ribosomal protein L11 methyltransferase n=1 Tax=Desulfurivibrio sp. C05AmB TaxID=3374371 RepID=UPI00376F347A
MLNKPRTWLKISIQCPTEQAEAIAALLASCSDSGVEQGYTGFGEDSGWEEVTVYLEQNDLLNDHLETIHGFLGQMRRQNPAILIPEPQTEVITECDWNAAWKKEFTPLAVAPGLTIKPSWEDYTPQAGEKVIEMDPGMAFGTGHHASTRLALQLLKTIFASPRPPVAILDAGCGTAILAMAAALWGGKEILALDNDPLAVEAAQSNIQRNRLENIVRASATPIGELKTTFEAVIANITADVLLELATVLTDLVRPGGHLVLAGILVGEQANRIEHRFRDLGLNLVANPCQEEWAAFLFHKPAGGEG